MLKIIASKETGHWQGEIVVKRRAFKDRKLTTSFYVDLNITVSSIMNDVRKILESATS